ncbi:MAG: hypothetical protein IPP15_00650 [Saprospiraceae bacterium]|uniref:Uncharacterized protein n=1 Tax=Candidatus Opimibacter skivensis TaxID=2982028 RepID=A0A9D7SPZ8_9BACT|nr:hypothetical protein [Candidatus Opimibacter skivensis]
MRRIPPAKHIFPLRIVIIAIDISRMKKSFILLFIALIILRLLDLWTTYRSTPTLSDEINPLSSIFGGGWLMIILTNFILVGGILYLHYFYTFKYTPKTNIRADSYSAYLSMVYFNEPGKFYQVLYRMPVDRSVLLGHLGFVLIRALIFGSILAVLNNTFHYYQYTFYIVWCDFIAHPAFFIYSLILLFFVLCFYYITHREYKINKATF